MKHLCSLRWKRVFSLLLCAALLCGNLTVPARAAADPLLPEDLTYEDGNVVLHKQAERIGADEWKINVSATIKEEPVQPPGLEVTFILDSSLSMKCCAEEELHNTYYPSHTHGEDCSLICTLNHTHTDACYDCGTFEQSHEAYDTCTYVDENGKTVDFTSRLAIAKNAINTLTEALPDDVRISRVHFGTRAYKVNSFDTISASGYTYLNRGVATALATGNNSCFTDDSSTRKVMIIVTDGAATNNDYCANDSDFRSFKNDGGIVYTVGFNHNDPNLAGMVANGGTYSRASNPDELALIFENLATELTAMLVDPMGSSVGFTPNSTQQPSTSVDGTVSFDSSNNTLYWNPATSESIANSTIAYSYTVSLSDQADLSAGVHSDVPLNDPTYLLYGIKTSTTTDMRSAQFPIPKATYAISTLQVNWKCGDLDLQTPTATESVICDYPGAAFETDYNAYPPMITMNGATYYYDSTVITKNGAAADGVNITDAAAFVVTHQYVEDIRYHVNYEYTGTVPAGAPEASANDQIGLKPGTSVTVAAEPTLEGYEFSGWTVADSDITVTDGAFSMPDRDVTVQGSWTKLNGYRVLVNYFTSTNNGPYTQDNDSAVEIAAETLTTEASVDVSFADAMTWNGNDYGKPALAEGSAAAAIEGTMLKGITPADPTATVTVNLYRDVILKAAVTVHFVDTEGNTLREDITTGECYVGDSFDVSEAEDIASITRDGVIYDFISDDDAAYTGTVPEGGAEITRVYQEREKATVTVRFEDEAGNALRESMSETVYRNTAYDVLDAWYINTITKDGKIYDVKPDSYDLYSGTLTEDKTIVRVYRERAKATLSVTFVDTYNYFLRDAIFEDVYYYAEYDVREVEEIVSITTADGRIFDFIDDSDAVYTGTMPPQGYGIIRVYEERAKAAVTVRFVDEDGNALRENLTSGEIYVGGAYDVSAAEDITTIIIDGVIYDILREDSTAYTGTMPEGGGTITRVYKERAKAAVTVHFVDTEGNTLREDITTGLLYVSGVYDVSEAEEVTTITKDGVIYDFVSDNANAAYIGWVPVRGKEITRVYQERAKAAVTVHYVDGEGNPLQGDTTSGEIYVGSDYDVSAAEDITSITLDGIIYDFVSDDENAAYTGTMPEGGAEITRVYAERGKAVVIVTYVDGEGNKLLDDISSGEIYVGGDFDVSEAEDITSITKDGVVYDFIGDDDAAYTGIMPEGGAKIIRVYQERAKASATVHFVDTEGSSLQEDTVSEPVYIGADYDVSAAGEVNSITKDGKIYDFIGDDDAAYTGAMPEGGVEITRVYEERAKASVTVHYVDEEGNTLRADTTSGSLYVGSEYDVSAAESHGSITVDSVIYDFIGDGDAAYTGTMPESGAEITRVYRERAKASVTVRFVDTEGNVLRTETNTGDYYVGSEYDVSDAEDVTSITKDGKIYDFSEDGDAAYTGSIPEDGLTITRVYKERAKASVTVHYVDENGTKLMDDSLSESMYVGSHYDVSATKSVTNIRAGSKTYTFLSDANAAYTGTMPAEGVEITRVYRLKSTGSPNTGDDGIGLWAVTLLLSAMAVPFLLPRRRRNGEG